MPNFTVEDIKRLREATSLGMIECKRVLEESGGDYNKALELVRQAGIELEQKAKAVADGVLQVNRDEAEKRKIRQQEYEEKLRVEKSSTQMSKIQSELDSLQREVMALKKAHNALLAALEKTSKATPARTTTTYTSFYVGEF